MRIDEDDGDEDAQKSGDDDEFDVSYIDSSDESGGDDPYGPALFHTPHYTSLRHATPRHALLPSFFLFLLLPFF